MKHLLHIKNSMIYFKIIYTNNYIISYIIYLFISHNDHN